MSGNKYVEWRGIKGLVGAVLLEDSEENLKYDKVFHIAGISELSKETSDSSETHYYDNKPAVVIDAQGEDTVNVNVSAVSLETVSKITGQKYDEATGVLIEGPAEAPYMAIGYIATDTNNQDVYVWRLKGKFSRPGATHKTVDNGTSAEGQTLKYTGIVTEKTFSANENKGASAVIAPAIKCGKTEKEFFEKVQNPDDVITTSEI